MPHAAVGLIGWMHICVRNMRCSWAEGCSHQHSPCAQAATPHAEAEQRCPSPGMPCMPRQHGATCSSRGSAGTACLKAARHAALPMASISCSSCLCSEPTASHTPKVPVQRGWQAASSSLPSQSKSSQQDHVQPPRLCGRAPRCSVHGGCGPRCRSRGGHQQQELLLAAGGSPGRTVCPAPPAP